jgi:hypothetical protein
VARAAALLFMDLNMHHLTKYGFDPTKFRPEATIAWVFLLCRAHRRKGTFGYKLGGKAGTLYVCPVFVPRDAAGEALLEVPTAGGVWSKGSVEAAVKAPAGTVAAPAEKTGVSGSTRGAAAAAAKKAAAAAAAEATTAGPSEVAEEALVTMTVNAPLFTSVVMSAATNTIQVGFGSVELGELARRDRDGRGRPGGQGARAAAHAQPARGQQGRGRCRHGCAQPAARDQRHGGCRHGCAQRARDQGHGGRRHGCA